MPFRSQHNHSRLQFAALATGLMLGLQPVQASAQEATVDCRVVTHENTDGEQRTDRTIVNPVDPDGDTLGDCGGVIAPPAVGDRELVEPAPDVGETTVLPPKAVPDQ